MIRDLFLGFIKLHILHHAAEEPIFGLDMIRELQRHGYDLSPGTLYPILRKLHDAGYLEQQIEVVGGKQRKYYRATPAGEAALAEAMVKVRELVGEVGLDVHWQAPDQEVDAAHGAGHRRRNVDPGGYRDDDRFVVGDGFP
jgi:DNA-binding PadR family transcriptional regulator